jgi:hypothetical protein
MNIGEDRAQMINFAMILRYGPQNLRKPGKTFYKLRLIAKLLKCSVQKVRYLLEEGGSLDAHTVAYQGKS